MKDRKIAILGLGCWGGTLGVLLAEKKYRVAIWEFSPYYARKIAETRILENLNNYKIPEDIEIDSDIRKVTKDSKIIIIAVPSQFVRETVRKLSGVLYSKNKIIINASKGLELQTFKRMSEIIKEELNYPISNICTLSGPSFAIEVIKKMPTAVVISGSHNRTTKEIQKLFSNDYFRVYTNNDIVGTELGGALKNVFAIASGISDGLGFGDNTKSAIITRGLMELIRLGKKMGANPLTFMGLSGAGDLIATCFSKNSRNRLFGEKIGQGIKPENALKEIKTVVEGYYTTNSAYFAGKKYRIDLPIINEVFEILYMKKNPKLAIKNLMLRKLKSENTGLF